MSGPAVHDRDGVAGAIVTLALLTGSAAETRSLAVAIGEAARPGWVILLDGPLGAGKTVFAQGILAGLGWSGRVASPTFTLINEYPARLPVWHADLYRLEGAADFAAIGGDELLSGHCGVTLVEWAEKLGAAAPPEAMRVRFAFLSGDAPDEGRRIEVRLGGCQYQDALHVLRRWGASEDGGRSNA